MTLELNVAVGGGAGGPAGPIEGSAEEFPAGWARAPLGELGEWFGGGTPSKKRPEFWTDGTLPWLSPKDMGPDVLAATQDLIHKSALDESAVKLVPAGSVALVVRSGILERKVPVTYVPFEATLNQDMKAVFPHEGIDGRWLAWAIRSQEQYILENCRKRGTTVASLEVPWLMSTEILVPPHAEQLRVAAEIEQQIARIEAGETAARTALTNATTLAEQVTTQGSRGCLEEVELFQAALPKADIDDGPIPDLPAGWKWARLGDIASVVGGVTKDSKRQDDPEYVEVPYLRVANVQRGQLVLDKVTTIRVPPTKADSLYLKHGDILLNEGGDRDKLGRGWVWEGQIKNCIHQNHVFRARVAQDEIHPKLLAWHANSFGKAWCDRNGTQSVNLASISLRKIKLLPVPVPPREVQEQLVKTIELHLENVTAARTTAESALSHAQDLRAALLHAAFTGTLVPQDPADEPASTLLDRIRAEQGTRTKKAPRKRAARKPRPSAPGQEELPS
ncbi:restriction endonuclease subunit S [Streptomyces sp. NBC_01221]|uniref:restriction endonuclease subunit S n=1 Tax=unclassified Streptomyces TaxID=2593676 RepID=UPI00225158B5|nr:restriction endonuclease subunit S [Streptomyces sp. NBC_01221]MCX4789383.1 restriction endonuclease subunit S [Streptomyces sp. NBC_01221]WSP57526.1 restriction endonuclease subunit S [Streptomyces sp. NBC_01241]